MFTSLFRSKVTLACCLFTLFITTPAWAEDIEIYFNGSSNSGSANVVFIIDTSTSMEKDDNNNGKTRLDDVQGAFKTIINKIATINESASGSINVAVMRFQHNSGGYFITPMQKISASNKQGIIDLVDGLSPNGFTPLTETLYESALYFRGEKENYGTASNTTDVLITPTNGRDKYDTPIVSSAQCNVGNHIVLLTDGAPSKDNEADEAIHTWVDPSKNFSTNPLCKSESRSAGSSRNVNSCLDELAGFLAENDQSSISGNQFVNTHTIAFGGGNLDFQLLIDTANKGQGEYRASRNAVDLANAFEEIINNIILSVTPDSMAAPALTVNTFNRLTHFKEIYFSLFQPAETKAWPGNVKGFILGTDPNDSTRITLLDANGAPAIENGTISRTARSLWSTVDDGPDVIKGGAASNIPTIRKVYTYTGAISNTSALVSTEVLGDLTLESNWLSEDNTDITDAMLFPPNGTAPTGVTTDALLKWGRGIDANDEPRLSMGDPLHSQPVVVTYGGTSDNPESVLFVATNEGYLHAINTKTGVEKFAFMPQTLLKNLTLLKNNSGTDIHPYGLDGNITTWVKDVNGDGTINEDDGDHVYLYVGMRRGGNNYYMLDVTAPDSPILKWIIQGGISNTDYAELGQSWSRPSLGKLKINSADKQVLIFGGGYDSQEDTAAPQDSNSIGRAIFIADAQTGQRLWSASLAEATVNLATMTHSIPSDVRVLDVNLDGYIDRLYVGDMGAQIFRVDINNGADSTATTVDASIGLLADFNPNNSAADDRRFFNAPDVVLTKNPGVPTAYLSINIGSGYRAHPLNEIIGDRFYSIRDYDVFDKLDTYPTTITEAGLYDASLNVIGEGAEQDHRDAATTNLNNKKGWFVKLDGSGEKVLAEAMTYNNKVFFSTYTPQENPTNSCSNLPGLGKLYAVNLFDATPIQNSDNAAALTKEDRLIKDLDKGGIPTPPTVAFPPGKKPTLLIGNESLDSVGLELSLQKTYWTPK